MPTLHLLSLFRHILSVSRNWRTFAASGQNLSVRKKTATQPGKDSEILLRLAHARTEDIVEKLGSSESLLNSSAVSLKTQ